MKSVGAGVYELRDADEVNWYRVIYLKKIEDTIYILHCFAKKSRKTPQNDLQTARHRLTELNRELLRDKRK